jgi:hypothetical protein
MDVLEHLLGLLGRIALADELTLFVDRDLTGDVDEPVGGRNDRDL